VREPSGYPGSGARPFGCQPAAHLPTRRSTLRPTANDQARRSSLKEAGKSVSSRGRHLALPGLENFFAKIQKLLFWDREFLRQISKSFWRKSSRRAGRIAQCRPRDVGSRSRTTVQETRMVADFRARAGMRAARAPISDSARRACDESSTPARGVTRLRAALRLATWTRLRVDVSFGL
jgi:hypothetical protein